jgi:hypothetical protein
MNNHPYKHTYAHYTSISTSERLSQLDLKIHEVSHQECLAVDGDVAVNTIFISNLEFKPE